MDNYYSILECSTSSTLEEMKKKYQELILKYHPDKRKESTNVEDDKNFQIINEAWIILKDPISRDKYDAALKRLEISSQPPIYETLTTTDLEEAGDMYSYNCRCGGNYNVDKSDLVPPECLVSCNECSFYILIKVL